MGDVAVDKQEANKEEDKKEDSNKEDKEADSNEDNNEINGDEVKYTLIDDWAPLNTMPRLLIVSLCF